MVAGLLFIGVAIVGSVKTYFDPGREGRIAAGAIGIILLGLGFYLYQKQPFPPIPPDQPSIAGTWRGFVAFPNEPVLHLVIHIQGSNADLSATADSPDQNASSLTVDSLTLTNKIVHFNMTALDVNFQGERDGDTISGIFAQHGVSTKLILTRD
jgi:hypothetical protein